MKESAASASTAAEMRRWMRMGFALQGAQVQVLRRIRRRRQGHRDIDADDEDEIGPFQRVGQGQSSAGGEGDEEDEEDPLGGDNSDVSESAFGA